MSATPQAATEREESPADSRAKHPKRDAVVFWFGLALLGVLLFPPWSFASGGTAGHGFLLDPPAGTSAVDLARLMVQCAAISLAGLLAWYFFGD